MTSPLVSYEYVVLRCVPRVLGVAQQVERQLLDAWCVALAQRRQRLAVTCLRTGHENRI